MSALRIYGIARTRAFRALWIAKELGLDYEHIPIEIGHAGARQPDYLAINPNGRLPAIDDDGFVLWESLAITLYLAKKHSTGRSIRRRSRARPRPGNGACGRCRRSIAASTSGRCTRCGCRRPSATRNGSPRRSRCWTAPFRVLDGALADRPYLLGDDFTVADLNVAAVISRAIDMDLAATPRLSAWLRRCLERPAALDAAPRCARSRRRGAGRGDARDRPEQSAVSDSMPKRSAGILMYRRTGAKASRCCWCIRAGRSGPRRIWAPGRSRKANTPTGEEPLAVAMREFEEETGARPTANFCRSARSFSPAARS